MQTVILAAGRGTRLAPLTDTMPKVMVEVGGQPLIERIIRQCVSVGLTDILLVVGYCQETVRDCIGDGSRLGATVTYVEQTELGGTGHAVRTAAPYIKDDFMLIFGDSLVEASMIADVYNTPVGAVGVAQVAEPSRYGIVTLDSSGYVNSIIEKPANPPSNLAVMAMYKMPYALLDAVQGIGRTERGEIEVPDAVRMLIANGQTKFTAVDITGVMDIANVDDLARANELKKAVA